MNLHETEQRDFVNVAFALGNLNLGDVRCNLSQIGDTNLHWEAAAEFKMCNLFINVLSDFPQEPGIK